MRRRMPSGQGPSRRSGPGGRRGEVSRPATARRAGAGAGSAERTPAPVPRRLTGRATVLLVVLAALALGYAYPVRVYLSQQAEIDRMEAGQAAQRRHIDDLTAEVAKWQDNAYVVSQAGTRLFMFHPGETPLLVFWDDPGAAPDPTGATPKAEQPAPGPWYGRLWSSIEVANR